MDRITMKTLEAVVDRLNRVTGSPVATWTRHEVPTGKGCKPRIEFTANVGNYHLDGAYGGYCLRRTVNEKGGEMDPLNSGYVSKRGLYGLLHAFLRGYEQAKCDAEE